MKNNSGNTQKSWRKIQEQVQVQVQGQNGKNAACRLPRKIPEKIKTNPESKGRVYFVCAE